jgi:hypothetical protein
MAISANTFSRAFLSPDSMIRKAAFYTEDTLIKEIPRFLAFFFTAGFSETWYQEKENKKLEEFVALIKDAGDKEKIEIRDEAILQVKSSWGELKIVESMFNEEKILSGTFNGVAFDTGGLKTIDEFKAYIHKNLNRNQAVVEYIDKKTIKNVTVAQSRIRSFLATRRKETRGVVPALRDDKGNIVAYEVNPGRNAEGKKQYRWVAMPPSVENFHRQGGFKVLTHENDRYVGFTLKDADSDTLSSGMLGILASNNFHYISPQIRVNDTQLIAKNLGARDLWTEINVDKRKTFRVQHFRRLATELDRLHGMNIVHRDIKPENMFFKGSNMVLVDLDSMGRVGTFLGSFGTPEYVPDVFQIEEVDNLGKEWNINAYKKDQYAFLKTVAEATLCLSTNDFNGQRKLSHITTFSSRLPCSDSLKINLRKFLSDPLKYELTNPLTDYFNRPNLSMA